MGQWLYPNVPDMSCCQSKGPTGKMFLKKNLEWESNLKGIVWYSIFLKLINPKIKVEDHCIIKYTVLESSLKPDAHWIIGFCKPECDQGKLIQPAGQGTPPTLQHQILSSLVQKLLTYIHFPTFSKGT